MAYKGLPIFVEALELLRAVGVAFYASVMGEGHLEPYRNRLVNCGAIRKAWLSDAEIEDTLTEHDLAALAHIEAKQSGAAAFALGAALPVVDTPAGGLREQIAHNRTGLQAQRVDSVAIADTLERLIVEPKLLDRLRTGVAAGRDA